jgi:DNA polymerase III gamma/tau subunit
VGITEESNFLTKYRPEEFDQVFGQKTIVAQLESILSDRNSSFPHVFLFTGPSGSGKTSLARIVGKKLDAYIDEVDAASGPGAEEMRNLMVRSSTFPLGKYKKKLVIIDEFHSISRAGFQAILKSIEEPPAHLYFAFCTTDLGKVPKNILTRCVHFDLKPVPVPDLIELIDLISECEGYSLREGIGRAIAIRAEGSPRQALALLCRFHSSESPEEITSAILTDDGDSPLISILRILLNQQTMPTWKEVRALLERMPDDEADSWVYVAQEYISKVMIGTKAVTVKDQCWEMLHLICQPTPPDIRPKTRLLRFVGRFVSG